MLLLRCQYRYLPLCQYLLLLLPPCPPSSSFPYDGVKGVIFTVLTYSHLQIHFHLLVYLQVSRNVSMKLNLLPYFLVTASLLFFFILSIFITVLRFSSPSIHIARLESLCLPHLLFPYIVTSHYWSYYFIFNWVFVDFSVIRVDFHVSAMLLYMLVVFPDI